jgi:DNA-binding transcriptional LysR family regulator
MDIRSLRCLIALAKRLNFSRAADDLNISQPSLTRTVQTLEKQLGQRLFDRDRSGVRPTAQGLAIIERARQLLAEFDDFERQTRLSASGLGGKVRIGIAPLPARALLPAVLAEQFSAAPHLSHEILVRNVEILWPLLIADEIEFLVTAEGQVPDNASIRSEVLGQFWVSLLARSDHPLINGGHAGQKYPILLSSRRGLTSEIPDELRQLSSSTPHVVEDYEAIKELLKSADAIWLASPYAVTNEVGSGELCELPHSANLHQRQFRMMIYSLERRTLSPAASRLRETLRYSMKQLANDLPMTC